MIIWDLDGTLADCQHRRHFVEEPPMWQSNDGPHDPMLFNINSDKWRSWKPDWKAFFEACDQDKPILPVFEIFKYLQINNLLFKDESSRKEIQIWSGRCESVRAKTNTWLMRNGFVTDLNILKNMKMRPIGDNSPDDQIKERWLDEALAAGKTIDFVFDDRPKVVRMWRRRGIFVFDCNQMEKEF